MQAQTSVLSKYLSIYYSVIVSFLSSAECTSTPTVTLVCIGGCVCA